MIDPRAERSFQRGLELLASGRARDAVPLFAAAVTLQREGEGAGADDGRYLSYHGLSLGMWQRGSREALQLCRRATALEGWRADVWWNLGRVARAAGRQGEAWRALQHGLALQSDHSGILSELHALGVRRRPVLAFLARSHPLNVFLGQLRQPRASAPRVAARPFA